MNSKQAPPITRKLLIGQLSDMKHQYIRSVTADPAIHCISVTDSPPPRNLFFSLVWLQGHVLSTNPETIAPHFLLDDATGSIFVQLASSGSGNGASCPDVGEYVSVVGDVVPMMPGLIDPFAERNSSLKDWCITAKSVMSFTHSDQYIKNASTSASAFAEMAWPMEVKDMCNQFWTPVENKS